MNEIAIKIMALVSSASILLAHNTSGESNDAIRCLLEEIDKQAEDMLPKPEPEK